MDFLDLAGSSQGRSQKLHVGGPGDLTYSGMSETVAGSPYTPPLPLGSRSTWYTDKNI